MKLVNIHKLLFSLILLFGWNSLHSQEAWTLSQCVDTALQYNRNLQISRNNVAIGRQRQSEATANLIPKLTFNADYKYFSELPHQLMPLSTFNPAAPEWQFKEVQFGVPHNINANLLLAMPLYQPQIIGAIKTTQAASDLTELQVQKAEEDVIYDVTTLFYNAQILYHQLQFIDSNLVNTASLLKNMRLLQGQLLAKGTDADKVELQYQQLSTLRENVENKYAMVLNSLKITMGRPLEMPLNIATEIFFEQAGEVPLLHSLDLKIVEAQNKLLKSEKRTIDHSRYLPSLSLIASYGTTGFGYDKKPNDFLDFYQVSFAGVQLTYPLFNGTVSYRKSRQKFLEIKSNELQHQLVADRNAMQTDNARRQRIVAWKNITDLDGQMHLAQTIYDQTVLQQKEGVASLTDVLLADQALMQSQQNYLSAVVDYLKADLELKKLTGNISKVK